MRLLLTLMAMAVLVVSIGCDKKEAEKPATGTTGGGAAEVETPKDASATPDSTKTQTVSLKLPGMTWGGCAASVRSALNTLDGIKNIETNTKDQSCSFVAPANLDVAAALDKFAAEGNEHIKGWSKADEAAADDSRDEDEAEEDEEDDADGDAAATASKAGTQTVSLKLPGMTWGGCAASVRSALKTLDGVADIETSTKDQTCSFTAPADLDIESALNKFADGGNKHIAGWSKVE